MTRRKMKDKELWGLFRKSDVEAEYARRLDHVIEACAGAATRWLQGEGLFYEAARVRRSVQRAGRKAAGRGR